MKKGGQEKIYEMVTNEIIAKLEEGVAPWKKPWSGDSGFVLPKNLKSGKSYRGVNVLLLGSAGYSSRYWLSYKQASSMGGQVKKGEKGHLCIFWNFFEKEDDEGNVKKIPYLRYYKVFNLNQIEGIEDPDKAEEKVYEHTQIESAEKVVLEMQKRPKITHNEQRAYYRPSTDTVNMPKKESFEKAEGYYSTIFHELIHSTGHTDRLGRREVMSNSFFGSEDYSFEELVAEMGASFLCAETGISEIVIDNSASYINSWLKALRENNRWLVQAASKAQKAVDFILNK